MSGKNNDIYFEQIDALEILANNLCCAYGITCNVSKMDLDDYFKLCFSKEDKSINFALRCDCSTVEFARICSMAKQELFEALGIKTCSSCIKFKVCEIAETLGGECQFAGMCKDYSDYN